MAWAVIFIDGEHLRKTFIKAGHKTDMPKIITKLIELSRIPEEKLLRVYYYTAPPYQSSSPTTEEKERYKAFQRFESFLKSQDNFVVILGRTEKRGGSYKQKMVDVLLSIDLVDLSAKSTIDTALLIAGDSDLVPAVEKAKTNGVRVILFHPEDKNEYHRNLWEASDKRIPITGDFMKECSHIHNK